MDTPTFPGLTNADVIERQKKFGKNIFVADEKQSAFRTFLEEFKSPLIIILLVAAVIALLTDSLIEGFLIIVIVIASSVLDFVVSYKSQKAADTLAKRVSPKVQVKRDGKIIIVETTDMVPDDIVLLEAGDIIPGDGVVVSSKELYVNESALTGESVPTEKPLTSVLWMGSGVVSGEAVMRITATGTRTKFASIVSLLAARERPTEFEKGISAFSKLLTRVVIILCVVIFAVNAFTHHDILSSLIFSLAIAVGITPELLPMIIAVNLSRASLRMAKRGVIVKKLSAIENFGGMDILCTDKTGTLTEDQIALVKYVDSTGMESQSVLEAAYINSALRTGTKGPLDAAIIAYQHLDPAFVIADYTKVNEIPFDFERRRDSLVVSKKGDGYMLITKGAPEEVMYVSTMTSEEKSKAKALFESLSSDGYRVIGVATGNFSVAKDDYTKEDEHDLCFAGFIAFIDPPKQNVKAVLESLEQKSIAIKIVTGDHRLVAEKIVHDVGLVSLGTLDGSDIDTLTDDGLRMKMETTTIFSRVTPIQKNRIIMALQAAGHTVGYMGDGINDAPALRTADVGISVDNATDVAKESADIVLLTKDLAQLVDGVVEGRRTFANTMKYITMAVSSNFGNMISMTAASVVLPFLPMLPTQILLNNLLYETSQLATIADTVDPEILNRPNPWNIKLIKRFMVVFGLLSSAFDFLTFYILLYVFHLANSGFQTAWFLESFLTQTFVIFFIRSTKRFWKARKPSLWLVASAFLAVVVAWIIALTHIGNIFGFSVVSFSVLISISAIAVVYFIAIEITKKIFYRNVKL